jgi:hypothetical protein
MPVGWSELPDIAGQFRWLLVVIALSAVLRWTELEAGKSIITGNLCSFKTENYRGNPTIQIS